MNIPIFRGTDGLRTESDPARSVYSAEQGGLRDLAACMNVDVSDSGRISRRKGMERKVAATAPHSLFSVADQYLLFVQGDALSVLAPDLTTVTPIRNVTVGARMSYCLLDGKAYYCNGFETGYVQDQQSRPWVQPAEVVGRNLTRVFHDPPVGQRIAYYHGRMYVAEGKTLWYSEPYGPDLFAKGDSFESFESTVKMVRPAATGIYVSDEHDTWFLSGKGPGEFEYFRVDTQPVLPFSDTEVNGAIQMTRDGGYTFTPGKTLAAFWLTAQGVVFGSSTGEIEHITAAKFDWPTEYSSGACLVHGTSLLGIAL